jgi:hypothetical protein
MEGAGPADQGERGGRSRPAGTLPSKQMVRQEQRSQSRAAVAAPHARVARGLRSRRDVEQRQLAAIWLASRRLTSGRRDARDVRTLALPRRPGACRTRGAASAPRARSSSIASHHPTTPARTRASRASLLSSPPLALAPPQLAGVARDLDHTPQDGPAAEPAPRRLRGIAPPHRTAHAAGPPLPWRASGWQHQQQQQNPAAGSGPAAAPGACERRR